MTRSLALLAATVLALGVSMQARASADSDWAVIEELDKGPQTVPQSRDDALRLAQIHFAKHRAALNAFLEAYPADPRVLDAKLRLISIRAAEGSMNHKPTEIRGALQELMALEKSKDVPKDRLADITFRRISLQMQSMDGPEEQVRESIEVAARNFAAQFPSDKRAPRLLVEAATQFDDNPAKMKDLLTKAHTLSKEPALDARIADDLRRINALNNPVDVTFTTIQGGTVDLKQLRGKVVVLLFWAAESPHCLLWMRTFVPAIRQMNASKIAVVSVSLDEDRADLDNAMKAFDIHWPTNFDGKGWENTVARPLGINAIPTVWLIDKRGVLRTLNARDNYEVWLRRLVLER